MDTEADPEHFEIEIADLNDVDFAGNFSLLDQPEENGDHTAKGGEDDAEERESSLLRASLSDVVLTQQLQFSAKEIDFDDPIETPAPSGSVVQNFDNVIVNGNITPSKSSSAEANDEFTNIFFENSKGASSAAPQIPVSTATSFSSQQQPSVRSQLSSRSSADSAPADFEDAEDPPLFTSTLKANGGDSDDEFDFDLPGEKKGSDKRVSFAAAEEEKEKTPNLNQADVENRDRTKDKLQDRVVNAPVSTITAAEFVKVPVSVTPWSPSAPTSNATVNTGGAVHPSLQVQAAAVPPPPPGFGDSDQIDIQLLPDDDEDEDKPDRSHIITSSPADWDNVETVEAGFLNRSTEGESMTTAPPLLSFSDMWQHFRGQDHSAVKAKIQVTVEKSGFAGILHRLFGPPRLNRDLHDEREHVFCAAATALDNADSQHSQSLQTIYRVLTGSRFNCQRFGSHWEEIGFQGRDPGTDLRGSGILGLVQLVNFLQDETTVQLARDIYKLSLHPTQNFPFCLMCINISRITLQALREGILNRECNRQRKVLAVVNQFYAGALLHLYRLWKQGKTIKDSGFVIKDVETRAKKQTKDLFKDLEQYIAQQKSRNTGGGGDMLLAMGGGDANFFNVTKSSDNKCAAELY